MRLLTHFGSRPSDEPPPSLTKGVLNIHMVDSRGRPMLHQHKNCGKMFDPVMVCSECGEPGQGGACASRPRRATVVTSACEREQVTCGARQ
jgi:hypothetical protein